LPARGNLPQNPAMKTDHDLLDELIRYLFESSGAPKEQVDLTMQQYRTMLLANLKRRPPTPLTDADYAAKLAEMKKEAPAFLEYLLAGNFHPLPGRFRGENN